MPQIFKVVLTGGPCGGKTTGQARLSSFFETLGWKVYRSPEVASMLLGGGVKFPELNYEQTYEFQVNLLKVMIMVETTFDDLARSSDKPCLVICDRGCMDPVAFMSPDMWERAKRENGWNEVELRDSRYDLIVHMVSAACGAETFYTLDNNSARMENDLELARERDELAGRSWLGHPYFEAVDNSTGFEEKIRRMIALVCERVGVNVGDRLAAASRKRKFLVRNVPSDEEMRKQVDFIDLQVEHDYLSSSTEKRQSRIRKRGRNGVWTYQHTLRYEVNGQLMETKTSLPPRDYKAFLRTQRSTQHYTIYKTRRCFIFDNKYFQLDMFRHPCPARCRGLILLETYTTVPKGTHIDLPNFLEVIREVTGDREYSMFTLSLVHAPQSISDSSSIFSNGEEYSCANGHSRADGSTCIVNALTSNFVNGCGTKQPGAGEKLSSVRHKSFSYDDNDLSEHHDATLSLPESPMATTKSMERVQVVSHQARIESATAVLFANHTHTITTVVEEGMQAQPSIPQSPKLNAGNLLMQNKYKSPCVSGNNNGPTDANSHASANGHHSSQHAGSSS